MPRWRASTASRKSSRSGRKSILWTVRYGWKESGMRAFPWVASSATLCAVLIPVLAQQSPTIKVDVNLVHAIATVKTQEGQLVGDLSKGDFAIYDNGARQEIAVFEHHTDQPLSVALQIDTSGSTAKELKYEADASGRFAHAFFGESNP